MFVYRTFASAAVFALLFAGLLTSTALAQQVDLPGTWVGKISYDKEKLAAAIDGLLESQLPANLPQEDKDKLLAVLAAQKPAIMAQIASELGKAEMKLVVNGDGTYKASTVKGEEKEETSGTWRVEKQEAGTIVLKTKETGETEEETAVLKVKDAKTILMPVPEKDAEELPGDLAEALHGMLLTKQ